MVHSAGEVDPGLATQAGQSRTPPPTYMPSLNPILDRDRELFDCRLRSFVVPGAFDAHAHLYAPGHLSGDHGSFNDEDCDVTRKAWTNLTAQWMGDLAPTDGLFFGLPLPGIDIDANNGFVARELKQATDSRGLLVVRPSDDAAAVESRLAADGFAGMKVYHLYADRPDPGNADIEDFLPEWVWQIADQSDRVITLHIVRARALADEGNQKYIRDHCRRYPHARLILAHAARGFCADHTVDGIGSLAGMDNVFFDTSAIVEPGALMAVLKQFGAGRLMYGSDYPIGNIRCRPTSVGDGFFWVYGDDPRWKQWTLGQLSLVGIDALLALRQASRLLDLTDADVERIFIHNARELLGIR